MKQVSLRYPATKVEPRVAALLPYLQNDNEAITVSSSKVMLMALLEGLEALEKRYGLAAQG